jgi:hypothetical protein
MSIEEQFRKDVGAISSLQASALREAVVRTWTAALRKGGHASLQEVPQSTRVPDRSLLLHVNEVNDTVQLFIEFTSHRFGLSADRDMLMAASILHDVDKAFIQRRTASGTVEYVDGYTVDDHGPAGARLAASQGVPEPICEIVRNHAPFNYGGHLPATVEGTILHYADLLAFDLAAIAVGETPIHSMSIMVKRTHQLARQLVGDNRN